MTSLAKNHRCFGGQEAIDGWRVKRTRRARDMSFSAVSCRNKENVSQLPSWHRIVSKGDLSFHELMNKSGTSKGTSLMTHYMNRRDSAKVEERRKRAWRSVGIKLSALIILKQHFTMVFFTSAHEQLAWPFDMIPLTFSINPVSITRAQTGDSGSSCSVLHNSLWASVQTRVTAECRQIREGPISNLQMIQRI